MLISYTMNDSNMAPWRNGIRSRLKICESNDCTGSSPVGATKEKKEKGK